MMTAINEVLLAVSSSLAASIVAKATVALTLGLIGDRLARRSRAAVGHALLAATFGVLLGLPIASIVIPSVRFAVPAAAPEGLIPPPFSGASGAIAPGAARANVSVTPAVPRSVRLSPAALLLTLWIAGAALFLLPVVVGLWQVRALRRSALAWRQGQPIVDRLALDAGIHRRVEVLLHGALPGPIACGVLHPAIVLPPDAQAWERDDLDRAIVHELEHVRRGDWITHCLARILCAVYWFHPLVWIARRRLTLAAERSCDDAVLGRSEAAAYADQLVGLARRLSAAAKSPLLAMANRADLATRVSAVLDGRQRRGRAGAFPVALACAAAAILILTMSPLRMVAAPQSGGTEATPMPRYSANGMLVTESVTVRDNNGQTIEGLTGNDFAVTEDGVPQTIDIFEYQKLADSPQSKQDSVSSYYIVGYYTTNQSIDGKFRKIGITGKKDTVAKLDYRQGYYAMKSFVSFDGTGRGGLDKRIGPDSTFPLLLYKKEPEYSEEARKAKYQGHVVIQVMVDAQGRAVNPRVIRSLGLGLDEKAIEAVKQWRFMPVMKDGRAVTMQVQVDVNYWLL